MNKTLFTYLYGKEYTAFQVDRLIASAFMTSFNLEPKQGSFIQTYSIQQNDDDYALYKDFRELCEFNNFEDLIKVFEFVISPEDKIITGAVYTPKSIREYIVDECFKNFDDLANIKICDPACGCGGFLYTAAKLIHDRTGKSYKKILAENIYGLDIQPYAIERSKLLLTLLALSEGEIAGFEFNLNQGNALNFSWIDHYKDFEGFNVVVGNPPYVCSRNIDLESRELLAQWKVSNSGHPDLYIPFFQIGVENLSQDGILGFITMNSFFKSVNGRALRQYFHDQPISLSVLDFGGNQIFRSKSTYTCICTVKKTPSDEVEYARANEITSDVQFNKVPYLQLNHESGWNLHHHDLLTKIEQTGKPFGKLYTTRNGIATLKNNVYVFKPVREDHHYYYLQNGAEYPIEKEVCRSIINPNRFTKAVSIEEVTQNAIFPYRLDDSGEVMLIDEQTFKTEYPNAYRYLNTNRELLAKRDKGKGKYERWYAYGRNQSLERLGAKLFFPHITPHIPNYTISNDEDLLFYNGLAVVSEDEVELQFLQKLMGSELFWFYIVHSSKPYGSGYFSLSRNYIKSFGVADFSTAEKEELIASTQSHANKIILEKYGVILPT